MDVLVAITEVRVLNQGFQIDGVSVEEQVRTYELNEYDEYALGAALSVAADVDDAEVVAMTMGPERAEASLRGALDAGADRAVRVWDEYLEQTALFDPVSKGTVLAAVAREEEPDLLLTGVESADDTLGATGVTLAERLGYDWAAVVNDLKLDPEAEIAHVHRELEHGVESICEVPLPAVLTVQSGIVEPPGIERIEGESALDASITTVTLSDLSVDRSALETPLRQTGLYEPKRESKTSFFSGRPRNVAAEMAEKLREEGVEQ